MWLYVNNLVKIVLSKKLLLEWRDTKGNFNFRTSQPRTDIELDVNHGLEYFNVSLELFWTSIFRLYLVLADGTRVESSPQTEPDDEPPLGKPKRSSLVPSCFNPFLL